VAFSPRTPVSKSSIAVLSPRFVWPYVTVKYKEKLSSRLPYVSRVNFNACDPTLVSVHGCGIKALGKSRTLTTRSEARFDLRVSFWFRKDPGL